MYLNLLQALASLSLVLSGIQVKAAELPPFEVWLQSLADCESQNNPLAVNPHDPVTRSSGLYQFKDSTFLLYAKKYSFFPNTWTNKQILEEIFNGHTQTVMVREMIKENYSNYHQWERCSKLIGLPPVE